MGVTALVSSVVGAGAAASGAAPLSLQHVAVCLSFLLLGLLVSVGSACEVAGGRRPRRGAARRARAGTSPTITTLAPSLQLPRPKFLERSATAAAFASPAGLVFRVSGVGRGAGRCRGPMACAVFFFGRFSFAAARPRRASPASAPPPSGCATT